VLASASLASAAGMAPRVARYLLITLLPGAVFDRRFQPVERHRLAQTGSGSVPCRHQFHGALFEVGKDKHWRTLPNRSEGLDQCETVHSGVEIEHDTVDVIKVAAQDHQRFPGVPAQAHAVTGSGRRFQDDARTIRIRVDQKDQLVFHIVPFVREK